MSKTPRELYGPNDLPPDSWWCPMLAALQRNGLKAETWGHGPTAKIGRMLSRTRMHRNFTHGRRAMVHLTGWVSTSRMFPRGMWNEAVVVAGDCWESQWDLWEAMLRRNRVRTAAFTSQVNADEFKRRIPHLNTLWLPEGIHHAIYHAGPPLIERGTDMLEMGRVYHAFHDAVASTLREHGKKHLHPRPAQHYMFPDHDAVRAAIADSKLFVCYPRCDTHPDQAGQVETLTLRYFEGFVSGALVVGRTPKELIDLFGYDPVIPMDVALPAEELQRQTLDLLENIGDYQELVDRNREHALRLGDWDARAKQLLDWLRDLGYTTESR